MAIQQQSIDLEDAIDIRDIKNLKLANQVLKIRRKKKMERDRVIQLENIQAQSESNAQAAEQAATIEMQKDAALTQSKVTLEQTKAELDSIKLQQEVEAKKQLMELEFQYNMQLKQMDVKGMSNRDTIKEDRKDQRTKIQATQQSELIEQRKGQTGAKNFESAGNDIISGDFGLEAFVPK